MLRILLLLFVLSHTAQAEANTCRKMTITGSERYPPIHWRDRTHADKIVGIGIELVQMAMREKGIEVESTYVGNWKRAQYSLMTGDVDVLQGVYLTAERQAYMDYSPRPFFLDPTAIFVRKGSGFRPKTRRDLIGALGSAPIGNSYGEAFDRFAKQNLRIEYTDTLETAFTKLLADRSQYVIYGLYPGLVYAEQMNVAGQIDAMEHWIISEGMYVAISKKSPCQIHKDYLFAKLDEYIKKGIPEQLLKKYTALWKEQRTMSLPTGAP